MSKKDEALKLALEALEHEAETGNDDAYRRERDAIREALAEQPAQQEPVVWMYVNKSTHETKFQKHMRDFVDHSLWSEVPLYGEPLANHELQCVCGAVWLGDELVHLPDKRPPAQRKPLTDEELYKVFPAIATYTEANKTLYRSIARAIEAKLREKNAPQQSKEDA